LDLVDRVLLHPPPGSKAAGSAAPAALSFARRLRRERFDTALLLTNSFRSALWARISGARRRIGFARDGRGWLLTEAVIPRPTREPNPVIDEYLRLAKRLGCVDTSRKMELAVAEADTRYLNDFWNRQRLGEFAQRGLICLNPGGAFGLAKHWPTTSFAELAQ